MGILYLVRHAQSQPSQAVPEAAWPLSPVGLAQAEGLVPILRRLGVGRLYTSPYARCRGTLAPFAEASGLPLTVHEGLRERKIAGQWMSDFREVWTRSWADFAYCLEGGESSWTCRARMADAVTEIAQRHPAETVALGSHGAAISLFMHYVDATVGITEASALRTPEVIRIEHRDGVFCWDRSFTAGSDFDRLATDFRKTPGVVA